VGRAMEIAVHALAKKQRSSSVFSQPASLKHPAGTPRYTWQLRVTHAGSMASITSSWPAGQLNVSISRFRASSTDLSSSANFSMRARLAGLAHASLLAYRRVVEERSESNTSRLLAFSVAPVAALSTMMSASSGGSDSVAPYARRKVY